MSRRLRSAGNVPRRHLLRSFVRMSADTGQEPIYPLNSASLCAMVPTHLDGCGSVKPCLNQAVVRSSEDARLNPIISAEQELDVELYSALGRAVQRTGRFIQAARLKRLTSCVVTLRVQALVDDRTVWVDAYRFRLEEPQFDAFIQKCAAPDSVVVVGKALAPDDFDKKIRETWKTDLEGIWSTELDRFDDIEAR